jgi:hypothetical protein
VAYHQRRGLDHSTWPTGAPDGDRTQWVYHDPTGLVKVKWYAGDTEQSPKLTYTYTPDGTLHTRTWARSAGGNRVMTTYAYWGEGPGEAATGEPHTVTYSDGTTGVTFEYDRLGRQKMIDDAVGSREFVCNDTYLRLDREEINVPSGGLYSKTITRSYQGTGTGLVPGRDAGFYIGPQETPEYRVTYGYDAYGRLNKIPGPGLPEYGVDYAYVTNSDLVGEVGFGAIYQYWPGLRVTRTYEPHRDLVTEVLNDIPYYDQVVSQYVYAYDALGRRKSVITAGDAFGQDRFNVWHYNNRSELTGSWRGNGGTVSDPPSSEVTAERRLCNYDNIGNRDDYTAGTGAALYYCTNGLNQYEHTDAEQACQTPWTESFSYDLDGNLTQDGTYTYDWDAENRLKAVYPTTLSTGSKKLEFAYDYMGRRVPEEGVALERQRVGPG